MGLAAYSKVDVATSCTLDPAAMRRLDWQVRKHDLETQNVMLKAMWLGVIRFMEKQHERQQRKVETCQR